MTAMVFLLIAANKLKHNKIKAGAFWEAAALNATLIHILLSLTVFSESYYDKLFFDGRLTWQVELMVLSGVLAIFLFFQSKRSSDSDLNCRRYCLLATAGVGLHLFLWVIQAG